MATQAKVPLGIFWDIENCCIPSRKSASNVSLNIRKLIQSRHPECGFAVEFSCVCDVQKMDPRISEGLHCSGVTVVHVNQTSKNAADDKLKDLMDSFIDKYADNALLVVITGDINFLNPILKARRKQIEVVLIHGDNCSQNLKNVVNETYLFIDIINGSEDVDQNVNQIKPAQVKVYDLPPFAPIDGVRNRLSKLSENCGGKVLEVSNGSALIQFSCKDDAQRAILRMNGNDCFGKKMQLSLVNSDSKPVKQSSDNENAIKSQVSNDCKSVIKGLETKKDQNLLKLVRKIVSDWKDSQIQSNSIVSVERNNKKAQEDGKVILFVTAVSAEASKRLISGAKQYINSQTGIEWTEFRELKQSKDFLNSNSLNVLKPMESSGPTKPISTQNSVSDDCKSVIRGLETKKDQNVAKLVRKIVSDWKDSQIQANFIVSVDRNKKQSQEDGKVTLFVTAKDPESNVKLVEASKLYFKSTQKTKWDYYRSKGKRSESVCSDESIASNNSQVINGNKINTKKNKLTEPQLKQELDNIRMNMKLFTGFLVDSSSDEDCLRQLYDNLKAMHLKYITKNSNAFKQSPINTEMQDIGASLQKLFHFYENKFGKPSMAVKNQSQSVKTKNMSVILGLNTNQNEDVLQLVQKIISGWNDRRITAQDIIAVSRDAKWKSRDGKAMLFVTAKNGDKNKLILKIAKINFNNDGESLLWNKYSGKDKAN